MLQGMEREGVLMGADLVAFIVKGPKKLPAGQRDAAVAAAKKAVAWVKKGKRLYYKREDKPSAAERELYWHEAPNKYLRDQKDIILFEDLADVEPEKFVDEFLRLWPHIARDASYRTDPDDDTQILLVAGDTSWGNEPEGLGYQTLKTAQNLGLFEIFGIR